MYDYLDYDSMLIKCCYVDTLDHVMEKQRILQLALKNVTIEFTIH